MKTEEEGAVLMVLLLAREPVHLGVTSKHSPLLIRGYPALQQRPPPAVLLTTPPPNQHNGAIIAAVTLRLGQTAHLYLSIHVTYSRPINSPAMSASTGWAGGGGVYASTPCHYAVVCVFGWGMGSTWLRLHPAGCAFGLGGSL